MRRDLSRVAIPVSPRRFRLFVGALGVYLFAHFAWLVPYASEVYGRDGMLPDPRANMTAGFFPDLLWYTDSGAGPAIWCAALAAVSLLFGFAGPRARRWCGVLLWLGCASLYHRNNLTAGPHLAFMGWLCLACAWVPATDEVPASLYRGGWLILACGYTLSGVDKFLHSPSWTNGEALGLVLQTPLARGDVFYSVFSGMPQVLQHLATWGALAGEALFLPLALFRRARPWAWLAMTAVQLGILLTMDLTELTIGMLVFHGFVFDERWLAWLPPVSRDTSFETLGVAR